MTDCKELRQEVRRVLVSLDPRWIEAASKELNNRLTELVEKELGGRIEHVLAWIPYFPGEIN